MDCLVTTLHEAVSDDSLLKIGESKFHVNDENQSFSWYVTVSEPMTYTIIGDAHFTNTSETANYGKTRSVASGESAGLKISNGNVDIVASNKYVMQKIRRHVVSQNQYRLSYDLSDLTYCEELNELDVAFSYVTGNISDLFNCPLTYLVISDSGVKGSLKDVAKFTNMINFAGANQDITGSLADIVSLSDLERLRLNNCTQIIGNISNLIGFSKLEILNLDATNVQGNINVLNNQPQMQELSIKNTAITGPLASIATHHPNLVTLQIDGTSISGDTSDLAGLSNLTTFTYTDCPNITGTWPLV